MQSWRRPVRFVSCPATFGHQWLGVGVTVKALKEKGADILFPSDGSAESMVGAALEEDAHGVILPSGQPNLLQYFAQIQTALNRARAGHMQLLVIADPKVAPVELAVLRRRGAVVLRDGDTTTSSTSVARLDDLVRACDINLAAWPPSVEDVIAGKRAALGRALTVFELGEGAPAFAAAVRVAAREASLAGFPGSRHAGASDGVGDLLGGPRIRIARPLRVALLVEDRLRRPIDGRTLFRERPILGMFQGCDVFLRFMAPTPGDRKSDQVILDSVAACRAAGFDEILIDTQWTVARRRGADDRRSFQTFGELSAVVE